MKLAATVILYNPGESLFSNLRTYITKVEKLYIFDNSKTKLQFLPNEILENSEYFHTGSNEGIAKRLNQALEQSKKDGYNYLLTMDQDSCFNEGDLQTYKELIEKESNIDSTAIYGVRYYPSEDSDKIQYNKLLITSGSILNVNIAKKLKGFDEALFIDGVDTDFCIRSYQKGYKTVLFNQIHLNHTLGTELITKNIFSGKKRKIKSHNPIRIYYIVRNHLYMKKKHPEYRFILKNIIIFNEIKNGLLYGGQSFTYAKSILLALYDYKFKKYGKINIKYGL